MKVIIGIGVPGCGKTTYLKPMAAKLNMKYINPDDIRQELTGDAADHSQELYVWEAVHFRLLESLKADGAVIDATYAKMKDRHQLIELCRQNDVKSITAYWFNLPLRLCIERNARRQRVVPENAIRRMHSQLKLHPPTVQEGFNEVIEVRG